MSAINAVRRDRSAPQATGYLMGLLVVSLVSFNQRAPIVAVSPVVDVVAADLRIGPALSGALVGVPLLCFAVAAPLAGWLVSRLTVGPALTVALAVISISSAVRACLGPVGMLTGALVLGIGVTICNVGLPVLVKSRFVGHRQANATGVALAALNVGAMLALALAVPATDAVGWRLANAGWGVAGLIGIAAMVCSGWFRPDHAVTADGVPAESGVRTGAVNRWHAVLLGVAFGGQAYAAFAVTAWLAVLLREEIGVSTVASGIGASLFQLFGVVGAVAAPVLHRCLPDIGTFAVICMLWLALPVGLLAVPGAWMGWVAAGGCAQGLCIAFIFILVVKAAAPTITLSTRVQMIGYVLAAPGPSLVGWLAQRSWSLALVLIAVAIVLMTATGIVSVLVAKRSTVNSAPHQPEPAAEA